MARRRMKLKLKYKLILSYMFIALLGSITIFGIIHLILQKQFQSYLSKNHELTNQEIVSMVEDSFGEDGSAPDLHTLRRLGEIAISKGIILQVESYDGELNWCMHCESYELCHTMLERMKNNTEGLLPNQEGHTVAARYEMVKQGKSLGFVNLEYYGPVYFNDGDVKFVTVINRVFVIGSIMSIIASIVVGLIMSRKIAGPIQLIVKQTGDLEHGNYERIEKIDSGTVEVDNLSRGIRQLGFTLARQKEMRKRIMGNYAHELRTPLAVLQTNLEAMIDGIWEADKERLNSCNDEIIRLTRMLRKMDELTELEQETILLDKTTFSLPGLLREVKDCFEGEIYKKKLDVTLSGEDVSITADKDYMEQVIMNLLSNAIKYTDEGGQIEIGIRKVKTEVILNVSDNGIGMEEEELPYIFDHLYRVDKSRNSRIPGNGIGLSVVHAIVTAHEGRIEVESSLGKGTNFTLYLPQ